MIAAKAFVVAWIALGMAGCMADARIARLRVELADDVRHGRDSEAHATAGRITALAAESFGPGTAREVRVRTGLAESWAQWQHDDRALELGGATLRELEQRFGPDDERLVAALLSLVRIHFPAHRWMETEQVLDRISALCRAVYALPVPPANRFGECRSNAKYEVERYYLAVGAYEKWYEEFRVTDALTPPGSHRSGGISMLTVLGRGFAENGAYPEAIWYLQRCVDELRPRYAAPDAAVAAEREVWSTPNKDVTLSIVDGAHSFHSQSPRCLADLLDLRRKTGADQVAGELASWQRNLWAAGPDLEARLVAKVRFADESWHADYLTSSYANDLAFYYAGKGRDEDATRTYKEAVALIDRGRAREGILAGAYPAELHIDELFGLGMVSERLRRYGEAESAYRRAIEIAQSELHPRHAWRLEGSARLARTLAEAGKHEEAEAQWRSYLDLASRLRGQDHADYALGLEGLARVLAASDRAAQAAVARNRAESLHRAYARRIESVRELVLPASLRSPPTLAN